MVDGNDRNSCRAGGSDVADGVPDHDRVTGLAAGTRDRPPQQVRMGLLQPERVRPANGGEAIGQAKRVKEPHREPFEFVGADRKTAAAGGELVERRFEAGERSRAGGDMRGVVVDEAFDEPIDCGRVELAPLRCQGAFDHRSCAAADQLARRIIGDRRQTFASEDDVERVGEIGRAVDQRAVEIENDGWSNHHPRSLPGDARHGKARFDAGSMANGLCSRAEGG